MGSNEDEFLIYHLFADEGVESEILAGFGQVVRVGLYDPRPNPHSDLIVADARDPPLEPGADLVVLHPECYKWARATDHVPDRDSVYEDQIPDARRVGKELGDDYIIENVPDAPLQDPVVLNGRMFHMPIKFERAFETSFPVRQPSERGKREDETSWWNEHGRPTPWWKAVKGYGGDYRKHPLVKSAVPAPYLKYLLQSWLADKYGFAAPVEEQVPLTSY